MTVECHFKNIRQQILNEIAKAELSIQAAIAWFTNKELFEALCEKSRQGIKVELIVINDYINNRFDGLKFEELIEDGGDFYFAKIEEPMHHKFCIIDGNILLNGSYNWTYYAEEINRENFEIFRNCNNLIENFKEEFNAIKKDLIKNDKIIPISVDYIDLYDSQNAKSYLAKDLLLYANYISKKKQFNEALQVVEKSRQFSLNNISFIKAAENVEKKIRVEKANSEKEVINNNINFDIQQKSEQEDNLKSDEVKRLQLEAKIAYHKKQYGESLKIYKKALEIKPEDFECLVGIGNVSWKTKNFEQLLEYAKLALNSPSGKKTTALNLFGLAYTDVKFDKEKALEYYDKCIELDVNSYVSYWNKSILYENDLQSRTYCLNKVIDICEHDLSQNIKLSPSQMAVFAQSKNILGDKEKAKELIFIAKNDFEQLNVEEKDYHDWDRIKTVMRELRIK